MPIKMLLNRIINHMNKPILKLLKEPIPIVPMTYAIEGKKVYGNILFAVFSSIILLSNISFIITAFVGFEVSILKMNTIVVFESILNNLDKYFPIVFDKKIW